MENNLEPRQNTSRSILAPFLSTPVRKVHALGNQA
jgi:hypothetical protein